MAMVLAFALAAAMAAGGCNTDEMRSVVITKKSDDPSVWSSVEKVLEEGDIDHPIKEIRPRIDKSILAYVVTLDCEPTIPGQNKVQVQYDRKWHLARKSTFSCRPNG